MLLTTELEGGLADLDIAAYCSLLLIGGTDTFPKSFANIMLRLHEHPGFLAFGCGPHLCLGMHVARLEARLGLEELFARMRSLEVAVERAERAPSSCRASSACPCGSRRPE